MKSLILALGLLLAASVAMAGETGHPDWTGRHSDPFKRTNDHTHNLFVQDEKNIEVKAGLDAPYLLRFTENLYLGSEAETDITNLFYEDDFEADNILITVKMTYTGTWFDFRKK